MQAQGTSAVNANYFAQLTDQVNGITGAGACAELQALANTAMGTLQAQKNAIEAQLAAMAPILALLTAPAASPGAIVTWITNFINDVLTPMTAPYATLTAQATQLASDVSTLATAIENAAARIASCSITVPPLT